MVLFYIIAATLLVSIISLVGIFTLGIKTNTFDKMLILLVGFAAGGLMGGAFLHLLPEVVEKYPDSNVFLYVLVGFVLFFLMERYLKWRHCHNEVCDVHTFTYINIFGDGIHNFTDGLIIAASFVTDVKLGIITTLAVIFHEVPQEIGDFGILVYGGFSKKKALICNFLCALAAVLGAVIGYVLSHAIENVSLYLISMTAGGFIYIAASDLIPELHKQKDNKRANMAFISFLLGIGFMLLAKILMHEHLHVH